MIDYTTLISSRDPPQGTVYDEEKHRTNLILILAGGRTECAGPVRRSYADLWKIGRQVPSACETRKGGWNAWRMAMSLHLNLIHCDCSLEFGRE